jgi:hypothetical protein
MNNEIYKLRFVYENGLEFSRLIGTQSEFQLDYFVNNPDVFPLGWLV